MKLSTKIILPIILISALLILLAGCFGTPDDSPGYTPGSITGRIVVPPNCIDCLDGGPCFKGISNDAPSGWMPVEDAIVTVIPHATLTDEDGKYTLTNIEPGVYYVITATYKNLVLKDVVEPDGVEAGKTYDAGTANCESTALGLVVEYFWDMGLDADEIKVTLDEYIETKKFEDLVATVCCIIEDCDNITNYCCLVECDEPGYTPELESITVNTGSMNLCLNDSKSIAPLVSVIAHYTEGEPSKVVTSSANITYTSNDPSIASISGTIVTAGNSVASTFINVSATYTEGYITVDSTGTVPVSVIDCSAPTYDLIMAVNPSGGGSTTPSVGGPYTYAEGTVVTITATTAEGYHFVDWTGDVADPDSASTTVTMDANKTVTANFEEDAPDTYTLTMKVLPLDSGTTTPEIGTHTGYTAGTVVNISATPEAGYHFVDWTGDVAVPDSASTTVTMDANKTVTANFARENIITSINIAGWENAGCHPNFDHPHEPYSYTKTDPSGIPGTIELKWLTVTNPNLKSVHFFANVDSGDVVTYRYTTDMNGSTFTGWFTLGGGYVSSDCIEIPGALKSPPEYPTDFYIKISVNGVNTCTIHIW